MCKYCKHLKELRERDAQNVIDEMMFWRKEKVLNKSIKTPIPMPFHCCTGMTMDEWSDVKNNEHERR